ncbi:hypothetical protein RDV84_25475 [Lysobacter yananisis]|uniref:Uncharacterized protein n=1 Tax=Lysobacter yananisis TaxID=1003114 RepID=A0ABY9P868_9GAMM|nr:hypothetical protein [Lysobacter yananisis]WMT03263.1 hypothetical protein RDV84_25475 [Lysobacter yananisis]
MFGTSLSLRAPARAGAFVAALRAVALMAVLSFCAAARADPVETERLMEQVRSERSVLESNLQDAYAHMDSGRTEEAVASFALARANATAIGLYLGEVLVEIRKSREHGQYTDARALERARLRCERVEETAGFIDASLAQMILQPSAFGRALIDAQRVQFDRQLAQLEAELALSQA